MEEKKSPIADLDSKRGTGFLLGLVVALALLLTLLEFRSSGSSIEEADDVLDNLSEDVEMLPAVRQQDMIAATPVQSKEPSERLNKVDRVEKANVSLSVTPAPLVSLEGDGSLKPQDDTPPPMASAAMDNDNKPLNFRVVQQMPEFPGGMVYLIKWLTKNLKYPARAQQQKIQGRVIVSFIVNKDGIIADAKVIKSVDDDLDREAMRVIRMMPKWKPGIQNDKPCRTMVAIPIVFKL